jgi:Fe2+ transport system protein FeoA
LTSIINFPLDHPPGLLYIEIRFQFHNSIPIEQQENSMSLTDLRHGQCATITAIPDEYLRVQLLRFGITCGSEIRCHCKLPLGPVVLKFGSQEIAMGREIARMVSVQANR